MGLITGPAAEQLRACEAPGCVLMFAKDHPRRTWCSAACGNRAGRLAITSRPSCALTVRRGHSDGAPNEARARTECGLSHRASAGAYWRRAFGQGSPEALLPMQSRTTAFRPGQERRGWRPTRSLAREGGRGLMSRLSPAHRVFHRAGVAGHAAPAPLGRAPVCRQVPVTGSASAVTTNDHRVGHPARD